MCLLFAFLGSSDQFGDWEPLGTSHEYFRADGNDEGRESGWGIVTK